MAIKYKWATKEMVKKVTKKWIKGQFVRTKFICYSTNGTFTLHRWKTNAKSERYTLKVQSNNSHPRWLMWNGLAGIMNEMDERKIEFCRRGYNRQCKWQTNKPNHRHQYLPIQMIYFPFCTRRIEIDNCSSFHSDFQLFVH